MLAYTVPDEKKLRVILDTDTACEADDPFAIAYALMSPKLMVKAIVASHFARAGSMERSRAAALRVTEAMRSAVRVLPGEAWPPDPGAPVSEGVQAMIAETCADDKHPLFILCMGALTNVARAFREAPDIVRRVTVVTIGGHAYDMPAPPWREFNFGNDVDAANAVLRSGADVWQIPSSVYASVRVGLAELQAKVMPCGDIGRYLFEQLAAYAASPAASWAGAEHWSLGDSPAVAAALCPSCGSTKQIRARVVNEDTSYGAPLPGSLITVYQDMDARYLLEDFFSKLRLLYADTK